MKPSFEQVLEAFQTYLRKMLPSNMPKISDPNAWQKKCDENIKFIKTELGGLGIADMIDWEV